MSRVAKRSTKRSVKTEERIALAAAINELGFEVMPCSHCFSRGLCCRMIESSSRCGECVRRGRSYDGSGVPVSSLSRIVDESKRLDRLEQDAKEALRADHDSLAKAQRRLDESLARLDRIRRQKRSLLSRGSEMVRRGLASLDELEEVEQQESGAVLGVQLNSGVDVVD
ncbi:hypothetical protein MYCTH_77342 [Thermothelomyces thermophilus ATCC 42464]|uniref:Uncharacterized protein n=1 Tax=Thermothelomyces thermophilus (strain ATCC 42464 / BCRC 31852 / DSM 1799) TaxID=573729 RepID=G2Q377_THET4|nr:uncharacterized protein MYCTH_77342 [Thermothelomyces thermophilus ATCC 42464]AEO54338.1 hypothetical protein MYCTH_77342 [Thermothelomyces thermophilus ATCC 42464]